jgi:hypothetical protein
MPSSQGSIASKHWTGIIVFYAGTVLNLANAPGHENDRANGPGDYGCVRDPPNLFVDRTRRIGFEHPVGNSRQARPSPERAQIVVKRALHCAIDSMRVGFQRISRTRGIEFSGREAMLHELALAEERLPDGGFPECVLPRSPTHWIVGKASCQRAEARSHRPRISSKQKAGGTELEHPRLLARAVRLFGSVRAGSGMNSYTPYHPFTNSNAVASSGRRSDGAFASTAVAVLRAACRQTSRRRQGSTDTHSDNGCSGIAKPKTL